MRLRALLVSTAVLLASASAPLGAWGFSAHRFIMDRAIDLLPPGMKAFYDRNRAAIVERAIDPDTWRNAGFDQEPPNHFVDLDAYGKAPFPDLPRAYDAALQKYGRATLQENGMLPWRTAEFFGNLQRAFERLARGGAYSLDDITLYSGALGHYLSDAHVPLHAVVNYDGQLTSQQGIHARFESELFERYVSRLTIAPPSIAAIANPRDFSFDALLESFRDADAVFKADRAALGTGDEYDDRYFERFYAGAGPVLERRLSRSIAAVAAGLVGAWKAAGSPPIPLELPRRVRRVRR
jgi:hypothetical protein